MRGTSTTVLRRRKVFHVHVAVFVVAQVLLFVIWDLQRWLGGTGNPWFLYVMVVWGIGLAAHYVITRDDPDTPSTPHRKPWITAKRAAMLIATALALLIGGTYLFLERPWSDYSLIDMLTMFDSDKRVYSFQHMDQIFPAESITAAPVPFEFPRAERPLPATYRFDGEDRRLDRFLKRTSTTGLLVIKGGTIVHERYYLGASASSRFTSWSMAKSFVATLVGQAMASGRIHSLEDPISAYVPELVGTSYDGVPIRDVLEMASGVEFDETYGSAFSDINLFFVKLFALGQSANDVMDDYGRAGPSGEEFHYSSLDSQALGMLVSAVYHRPLVKVLEDHLWHPLGAGAAYWNIDDTDGSGTPLAFCCLNARLRDFARLGQLYLQAGHWRGRRLLPAGWVRQATTPPTPFLEPGALPKTDQNGQNGYAYQWWVPPGGGRRYMAAGLLGQYIYVSEPDNLVIARTSTDSNSGDDERETLDVFQTIAKSLARPAATTPARKG